MELIEDQSDDAGREEAAGSPPDARAWWTRPAFVAASLALVAGLGVLAWAGSRGPADVAVAVPAGSAERVRGALAEAGIHAEVREGMLWVSAADAPRAAAAAQPGPAPNAVAQALEDESIFASGETSRARRTAAVIRELESSIAMQPGVARASVVLGDAGRPGAPGSSSGPTASVTVRMRSGAMGDDLVDAVAVLVAGACPGMRPESVAIVDAGAGRVRQVRGAAERASAAARIAREERLARFVDAALVDVPGASAQVAEAEGGSFVAQVRLPRSAAAEQARIAESLEPILAVAGGCPVTLSFVVADAGTFGVERTPPEAPLAGAVPAPGPEDPDRSRPLGRPGSASDVPLGWGIAAALGVGVLAWWSWSRRRSGGLAAAAAAAEAEVPDFDEEPVPGAEASDAVRAAPAAAAAVLGRWLDAGYDELTARLVVALDASASASVLRALAASHVERVTEALGALDTVSREDLADAVESFLTEFPGPGGYRAPAEAA
jgi:hypothetical protein